MASHTASKEARNRAVSKFVKEKYDRVGIRFTKESGLKERITEHAKKNGESVSAFIIRAIIETMENDNKKTQ